MVSDAQNQKLQAEDAKKEKQHTKRQTKTALLCTSEQVHNRYTMQIFGNDCCIWR